MIDYIIYLMMTPISACIWTAMFIIYRVSLAVAIAKNAEIRQLDNANVWALITGLFGCPIAGLYFLMNIKLGGIYESEKANKVQKRAMITILAVIIISVAITPLYMRENHEARLKEEFEESIRMAYLNEDETHYICYDKMGNTYSTEYDYWLPLYTESGIKLKPDQDLNDEFPYDYTNYISQDGKINIEVDNAFINKNGYVVDIDHTKLEQIEIPAYNDLDDDYWVFEDKNGEMYFNPEDCSWDRDGNLVFKAKEITDFVKEHKG